MLLTASPWTGQDVKPLFSKFNNSGFNLFIDGIPKSVPIRGYISVGSLSVTKPSLTYCS
jgi:beta-glucosidase